MSFGTLFVRVALVGVVPGLVTLFGYDAGAAVILLSVLAAVFEFVVTWLHDMSGNGKRGRKEKSIRPLKSFPLQLAVLYIVQLWFMLLRQAGTSSTPPAANTVPEAGELSGQADVQTATQLAAAVGRPHLPPLPGSQHAAQDATRRGLAQLRDRPRGVFSASASGEAEAVAVAPADGGKWPLAKTPEEGFVLDAPPHELRWKPETISVVLPCAEERDFALKTVQAVWKETPANVLHEIVVVDDGSNPPLSQTHLTAEVQKKYKVKIMRHENTVGLIGAKKTGGDAASGDIIVFFDCHVGPQRNWHEDFLRLISENYRRMVIPQITSLNIDSWTQIGGGGGMSKCYVTWDGDFKWGGTDDMYMGMLSGGLAGLSRRWWQESGGYDDQMLGWGGENIDQGIRMWVCGGEIVAAPNSQVAHMWRTGEAKTAARYKHVGDTSKNRARAMNAWMGEFSEKLKDFPMFAQRLQQGGPNWFGNMANFQKVKDRLQGCRPFAWYLRRFKVVYEDAGLIPEQIYMLREETSGKCLRYQGGAGTSGQGREGVVLEPCDANNHRFFWHPGNRNTKTEKCCGGLRAWNTDQCLEGAQGGGKAITGICELSGRNFNQHWKLHSDGTLRKGDSCLGPGGTPGTLKEGPCFSFRSSGGSRFTKQDAREPIETKLYHQARKDHPETFRLLDSQSGGTSSGQGPKRCQEPGTKCVTLWFADGSKRCINEEGALEPEDCAVVFVNDKVIINANSGDCLDTKSDSDPQSFVWYQCHRGTNQQFELKNGRYCPRDFAHQCFEAISWS